MFIKQRQVRDSVFESKFAKASTRRREHAASIYATAVVQEVFIKLIDRQNVDWKGRSHFYAVSASAMRDILVDHARQQAALKRGGNRHRIPL